MADDLDSDVDTGSDEAAMAAFSALLKGPQAPETEAAPEPTEIQPKAAAEAPQASEANADETAEAAGSEEANPAPETSEAAPVQPQPVASQQVAPAEDTEAKAARDQLQSAVTYARAFIGQIHAQVMGEFSDIKTLDDLNKVGEVDPGRYNRFILAQGKMQNVVAQYKELERKAAEAKAQEGPKVDWASEKAILDKAIPDLSDPVKGPALERQLIEYAKEKNISPAGKTAAEIVTLYESMQYRNEQKARAAALAQANQKAAKAPPVQTPGAAKPKNTKADKLHEDFGRLQKTGRDEDATAVFRSLLSH